MTRCLRGIGAVSLLLAALEASAMAQAGPGAIRNHFDTDAVMRPPAFFDFVVLGAPAKAQWIVTSELNPPSPPNDVTQTVRTLPADSIAVALRRNVSLQDGRLSMYVKRGAGRGGMVFRMAGEKDFLIVLMDLASGNTRLACYRAGKPEELGSGNAALSREWGVLAVELKGPDIQVWWQGQPVFSAVDPAPAAGRAGMAASGPGLATFDEFIIDPAEPAAKP